jgi:hypothetical protein
MPAMTSAGQLDTIERLHEHITRTHEDIVSKTDLDRVDMVPSRGGMEAQHAIG